MDSPKAEVDIVIHHHPEDHELLEYSAGTCGWAEAIAIGVHLHFCSECAAKVAALNAVGAEHLSHAPSANISSSGRAAMLDKIRALPSSEGEASKRRASESDIFSKTTSVPGVVAKIIRESGETKWKRISKFLKAFQLKTGQDRYEVSLHKIKRGGSTVKHGHSGKEIVIVLEGSFSDESGSYYPGDYLVNNVGDVHSPMATKDKDCICLSLVESPVQVSGWFGFFVNPFLKHNPM